MQADPLQPKNKASIRVIGYRKKGEDIFRSDQITLRRNDIQKCILVLQKAQEELLLNKEKVEEEEGE